MIIINIIGGFPYVRGGVAIGEGAEDMQHQGFHIIYYNKNIITLTSYSFPKPLTKIYVYGPCT